MTLVEQPDAGGNTVRLLKINNFLYPPFSADVIEGVPNLEIRENDVIVCAYPKAGTHWVWEIARQLLAGETTGVPLVEKDNCMIEWMPAQNLDKLPSPRVLNTHLLFRQLPAQVKQKRCKIVYVNRNPKDLAVSCYHHHRKLSQFYNYEGTWDDFLPLFLNGQLDYGSWFDYVKDWERTVQDYTDIPIHVTSYEELKQDPIREVRRLSTFLSPASPSQGITPPAEQTSTEQDQQDFTARVVESCSFHSMKARKGGFDTGKDGEPIMYRKGEVGDWKNWFSVVQNEAMDGYLKQYMSHAKTKFIYALPGQGSSNDCTDGNMNVS